MNISKPASILALILLAFALPFLPSPKAAEPTELPTQGSNDSATTALIAPPTDDATLNLHRWGAVTLFHGLPSDRVRALVADPRGAMWIGTNNGLVRYDGRTTQAFARENELPSRRILALAFDAKGNLWIGTESGAVRVRGERVEPLSETQGRSVTGIVIGAQNEIILCTAQGEIFRYQEIASTQAQTEKGATAQLSARKLDSSAHRLLTLIDNATTPTGPLQLTAVTRAPAGEFAFGSLGRGVLLHTNLTGAPNEQLREIAIQPPRPYHINALYHDGQTLWIGEQSNKAPGLWTYANGSLLHSGLATGTVTALHGGDGDVWLGSQTQGAYLLRNGQVIEHLTFENTGGGLRSNRISTLYRDREGIVWFGTDRGVCRYDREGFRAAALSDNAQSNFVRALLAAQNGDTWCATNRGLFRLPAGADLGPWQTIASTAGRSIYALWEDSAHAIWAGTSHGLWVKAAQEAEFVRAGEESEEVMGREGDGEPGSGGAGGTELAENPQSALRTPHSGDSQSAIRNLQSKESVRSITSFRGVVYAAVFEHGIERVTDGKPVLVLRDAAAQKTVCLLNEEDRALWLGTAEGQLWRYDGTALSRVTLPVQANAVRALAWHAGRLWIGTAQGLWVREGEQMREALPGADVRGLLAVSENQERDALWVATQNAGLYKMLPRENAVIRFDTEQGLASPQVFALATRASGDNTVWIGTARGVVRHRPSLAQPQLEIRRLLADRIYTPDYLTAELSLPPDQRNFLLEVTALGSRTYASQFQYEFTIQRRNGTEARTTRTTTPQFAAEALRAGPYTITARAFSRDLVASEPLTLKFRIQDPPFPRSTVLLIALLLGTAAVAFWIYRQRQRLALTNASLETTNAELRDTRLRLARETEAERERIARDLHDQTLADLRNLLVLTDQMPQPASDSGTLAPAAWRRKIESISNEIRHICEDLSPSVLTNIGFLPALEWALNDAVAQLPAEQKFAYAFECAPDLEDRLQLSAVEQIQLYRIVQEALSNIGRHARAQHVTLEARLIDETDLVLTITDDGCGFDGTAAHATGHGIGNIHSRANLIGATVAWERLTPGCRCTVRLPLLSAAVPQ